MPRKTITLLNMERGQFCDTCSFSYQSFASREERDEFEKINGKDSFLANRCVYKWRKKSHIPKDKTCEHWSVTRDTYGADFRSENKLSDKKDVEVEAEEEDEDETVVVV